MQWLAAFCASFCFHQDHWELCHWLPWEQLWAVHMYLSCQHSHLAGPEDKLVLEVMGQCSESQRGEMWIFWCEVFSHLLDYLEPQCHVVVTAELLYPSQLFWPKALAQMHLYQSRCAHPVLEKTGINLSSSFTFFLLIKAASSCPGLIALAWNPCNRHSSVSWTKDLSTSLADTVCRQNCVGILTLPWCCCKPSLFPFLQAMTFPVIKIQFFIKKLHRLVLPWT